MFISILADSMCIVLGYMKLSFYIWIMPLLRGSTIGIYAAKGIQETVSLAVWPITGAQQHSCRTVIGLEVEVGYIKHIRACVHSLHAVPLRAMIFQMCILFIVAQLTSISRSFSPLVIRGSNPWRLCKGTWNTNVTCGRGLRVTEEPSDDYYYVVYLQSLRRNITVIISLLTVRWEGGDKAPSYVL